MKPKPILRRPQEAAEGRAELEEQIRRRAYELYEHRGRVDGHALDDSLQAEAEVLERQEPEELLSTLLLSAMWLLVRQTHSTNHGNSNTQGSAKSEPITVIGCVSGLEGVYMLGS